MFLTNLNTCPCEHARLVSAALCWSWLYGFEVNGHAGLCLELIKRVPVWPVPSLSHYNRALWTQESLLIWSWTVYFYHYLRMLFSCQSSVGVLRIIWNNRQYLFLALCVVLRRSTVNLLIIVYPNFREDLLQIGQHWWRIRKDLICTLDWLKPMRKATVFAFAVGLRGIFSR